MPILNKMKQEEDIQHNSAIVVTLKSQTYSIVKTPEK